LKDISDTINLPFIIVFSHIEKFRKAPLESLSRQVGRFFGQNDRLSIGSGLHVFWLRRKEGLSDGNHHFPIEFAKSSETNR
jgi:hypothetical protein